MQLALEQQRTANASPLLGRAHVWHRERVVLSRSVQASRFDIFCSNFEIKLMSTVTFVDAILPNFPLVLEQYAPPPPTHTLDPFLCQSVTKSVCRNARPSAREAFHDPPSRTLNRFRQRLLLSIPVILKQYIFKRTLSV